MRQNTNTTSVVYYSREQTNTPVLLGFYKKKILKETLNTPLVVYTVMLLNRASSTAIKHFATWLKKSVN